MKGLRRGLSDRMLWLVWRYSNGTYWFERPTSHGRSRRDGTRP